MTIHLNSTFKQTVFLGLFFFAAYSANAQLKYGFKTGLNFARTLGDSETDNAGNELESWKNTTGFHIGMTFAYKFTDNFGLRGEFLYSKRGTKYTFDGPAYRIFNHPSGNIVSTGNARYLINVNNSYLDIPVLAYGRLGNFEISAGPYIGLLIQSSGEGSLRYSGKTLLGNNVYNQPTKTDTELNYNLNYNYRRDDPAEGSAESDNENALSINADGKIIEQPKTLGAYYDYPVGSGRLYNALDYGIVGGLSYYISHALYISGRVQYGLADITNKKGDLAKGSLGSSNELIFRDDKDRHFVIQASVGFSF